MLVVLNDRDNKFWAHHGRIPMRILCQAYSNRHVKVAQKLWKIHMHQRLVAVVHSSVAVAIVWDRPMTIMFCYQAQMQIVHQIANQLFCDYGEMVLQSTMVICVYMKIRKIKNFWIMSPGGESFISHAIMISA